MLFAGDQTEQVVNLTGQWFGAFAFGLLVLLGVIGWLLRDRTKIRAEYEARELKLVADVEAGNNRERDLYARMLTMTGDLAPMLGSVQAALKESTATVAAARHAIDRLDGR